MELKLLSFPLSGSWAISKVPHAVLLGGQAGKGGHLGLMRWERQVAPEMAPLGERERPHAGRSQIFQQSQKSKSPSLF